MTLSGRIRPSAGRVADGRVSVKQGGRDGGGRGGVLLTAAGLLCVAAPALGDDCLWTLSPSGGNPPSSNFGDPAVFDTARGRVVVPQWLGTELAVWSWSGGTWQLLTASGPLG